MMPTEEELKDPWLARQFLKNPKPVPQLLLKPPVPQSSSTTNSEWQEFKAEIRGQVASINKRLRALKKDQQKSNKLLRRVLTMLNENVRQQGQGNAEPRTPLTSSQPFDVNQNESDELKNAADDIAAGLQDEVLLDSDIGAAADIGVQAAMEFLTGEKVIDSHQAVEEDSNKVRTYFNFDSTIYQCMTKFFYLT